MLRGALRLELAGHGDWSPRPAPIVLPEEDPPVAAAYEAAFSEQLLEDVRDDGDGEPASFHPLHLAGAEALRREEEALDF